MPDATVNLDPAILDHNLAALAHTDSAVAATLDAARPRMPDAIAAVTRDDQLNLRLPTPDGQSTWFGGTSIPQTRATALISQFEAGNANVLLPGISEGSEAVLLLKQLGSHRAVIVWEPEPVNLLLALRLHDFAQAIEDDRLVFVVSDEEHLAEALLATLERRPGHFCPDRIMMWPWHSFAGISDCRSAVETVYHQTEHRRRKLLSKLQQRFASLPPSSPTAGPMNAALLSIHANEETWAWADGIASAARQADWQLRSAVIRIPADVHPLSRASMLAEGLDRLPQAALLLDVCRTDIADVLPPSVPAITWLTHHTPITKNMTARLGPADRVIAVDSKLTDELTAAGLDTKRISIRPLPSLLVNDDPPPDWIDRPYDVVIIANIASTEPTAYGHELQTHAKLWQAAIESIRSRVNHFTDADIEAVLDAAESKLRMRIDHSEARQHICQALSGPVAAGIVWHDVAQIIAQHKLTSAHWGKGWSAATGRKLAGPIPDLAGRAAIYRQAKCVVFASPTGIVPPDVLLAAQAGAAVIWRRHRVDERPGGLATLLQPGKEAIIFAANDRLPQALQKLLAKPETWHAITGQASLRCQSEHLPTHALEAFQAVATSFFTDRTA